MRITDRWSDDYHRVLVDVVEPRRLARRQSVRDAARAARMSEANWRQLVRGSIPVRNGMRVPRRVSRDRLLDMAAAVGALADAAAAIGADRNEVDACRLRLGEVPTEAELEVMRLRHVTTSEKVELIRTLRAMRGAGDGEVGG